MLLFFFFDFFSHIVCFRLKLVGSCFQGSFLVFTKVSFLLDFFFFYFRFFVVNDLRCPILKHLCSFLSCLFSLFQFLLINYLCFLFKLIRLSFYFLLSFHFTLFITPSSSHDLCSFFSFLKLFSIISLFSCLNNLFNYIFFSLILFNLIYSFALAFHLSDNNY